VDKIQAMELVLGRLSKFQTNADFLKSFYAFVDPDASSPQVIEAVEELKLYLSDILPRSSSPTRSSS